MVLPAKPGFGSGGWGAWPPPAWPPVQPGGIGACVMAGTLILTIRGEVAVEYLAVGDTLVTLREDGPETRSVIWTGKCDIDIEGDPLAEWLQPVRVIADAFDCGLPRRDVLLSPGQPIYVEDALIEARDLVNGSTVIRPSGIARVIYHAIELDGHDALLADGLPVASFFDTGRRAMLAEHDAAAPCPLLSGGGGGGFGARLARGGEILAGVRARLQSRAEAMGLAAVTAPVEATGV